MQLFILILGAVSLFMDWYVFQAVKRLTADLGARTRRLIHSLYWLFFIGLLSCFYYAIYLRFSADVATPFVKWMINAFLTFFVTQLVFILVLFGEDLNRAIVAAVRFARSSFGDRQDKRPLMPQRRKFVSQLGLVLAGIPFASFVYGITKGLYDFRVRRQVLYFSDLPEAFEGFTITQVSDIHSGSLDDVEEVKRGIELVKAQNTDLFVFTGDLVNDIASEVEPFMTLLAQIKAPYGQYSVIGNHDYGMYHDWQSEAAREANLEELKEKQKKLGWRLLLDGNVTIEKGGEKISLLGVENWGRGFIEKGDLDKALQGVEDTAFKILLSHDPSHWQEKVKSHPTPVQLTLSGHTHGMQFGVETPLFKWSPVQYRYEHWAGLAQDFGRMLYVNRGFGFIGFSGRVGIWPEITVLELRKGKPPGSM